MRRVITTKLVWRSSCGSQVVNRLARQEVYTLDVEVFGQLELGRGTFVTIEALDYFSASETNLSRYLVKVRLRQSPADSTGPEIDIAARGQGQLSLDDDIGEIEAAAWAQHAKNLAECPHFMSR
jgi:hypothetical protein